MTGQKHFGVILSSGPAPKSESKEEPCLAFEDSSSIQGYSHTADTQNERSRARYQSHTYNLEHHVVRNIEKREAVDTFFQDQKAADYYETESTLTYINHRLGFAPHVPNFPPPYLPIFRVP